VNACLGAVVSLILCFLFAGASWLSRRAPRFVRGLVVGVECGQHVGGRVVRGGGGGGVGGAVGALALLCSLCLFCLLRSVWSLLGLSAERAYAVPALGACACALVLLKIERDIKYTTHYHYPPTYPKCMGSVGGEHDGRARRVGGGR
jgi:hypothetical protein